MKKIILVNAIVTGVAFLLDIYGIFNLSLEIALIGLLLGIVDVISFVWMREELKDWVKRRKRPSLRRKKKK